MNESRRPVYAGRRLLCNILKVYKSVWGGAVPRAFFRRREGQFRRRVTGFQRCVSPGGFFGGARNGFKGVVPLSGGAFPRTDFSGARGTVSKAQFCFSEARFLGRIFQRRSPALRSWAVRAGNFRDRSKAFRARIFHSRARSEAFRARFGHFRARKPGGPDSRVRFTRTSGSFPVTLFPMTIVVRSPKITLSKEKRRRSVSAPFFDSDSIVRQRAIVAGSASGTGYTSRCATGRSWRMPAGRTCRPVPRHRSSCSG